MKRALLALLLAGCVPTRTVSLTFGSEGEGLDGFMCRDANDELLLSRLPPSREGSLVFDFIELHGVPGCRTGQLIEWCKSRDCIPRPETRTCAPVTFDAPATTRSELTRRDRISSVSCTASSTSLTRQWRCA